METQNDLLRVSEVARRLSCHPATVRSYIRFAGLPAVRLAHELRVSAQDLEAWLAERAVKAAAPEEEEEEEDSDA